MPCGSLRNVFRINFMNQELLSENFRELEKASEQSQSALPRRCGISLGSICYFIDAPVGKGYAKIWNFQNVHSKLAHTYIVTLLGINLKNKLKIGF